MSDEAKDEVVGITAMTGTTAAPGQFLVVTKRGKLYRISVDDNDLVKLWIEVPV